MPNENKPSLGPADFHLPRGSRRSSRNKPPPLAKHMVNTKASRPSFCQPAALTQLCVKQIWKKVSALCYPHIHRATSHLHGMVNVKPDMHITCKINTRSLCNRTLTIHRPTFEHMAKRPKKPNPPSAAYRQMQIKSCENLPVGGATAFSILQTLKEF